MTLIAMCAYSTLENKKDECLEKTLESLRKSVDFTKHRMMLHVNAFTKKTLDIVEEYSDILEDVIWSDVNVGTAAGINAIWKFRKPQEHAIKCDDDVVINNCTGWIDLMESIVEADKTIGQVGLKRKDLWENPNHENPFYRSEISEIETELGKVTIEKCNHIMGTCVLHSSDLLDTVGYLYQPKLYGFDDSLMSLRSRLSGFKNVFIPHIDIDHIDEGATPYQKWKEDHSGQQWDLYHKAVADYSNGENVYYNPFI